MSIENAEILKLTARLIVGYLDEQNLTDAHKLFCETSRHLSHEEYLAFSQGIKTIDTSIGLVNIVSEYFYIKNKLNDFIKNCPKTSLIIKLIDTSSFLLRIDLILKVLRENLQKFDKCEVIESRKRRLNEDELFNISNTNTSTPETVVHCSKRPRVSFSKPLITLSAAKAEQSATKVKVDDESIGKKELHYISSPETSNKEDDVSEEEDEENVSNEISVPPPELLSETVLKKTDFVENLVEIINQTRSAKELEQSIETSNSPKRLTDDDLQEIISKTENENNFEAILQEVIGKYLHDEDGRPTIVENGILPSKPEEIPLKQRLRPRTAKKTPVSEKKKKKNINIISNEIYSGPLPLCVQPSTSTITNNVPIVNTQPIPTTSNQIIINNEPIESQTQPILVNLVPIIPQPTVASTATTFIPLSTFSTTSNIICESNAMNVEIPQNVQIILSEQSQPAAAQSPIIVQNENQQNGIIENTIQQTTPKVSIQPNFLNSKCKSTPRRKASHIRILDFNQTPSVSRLTSIKEFQTPNSSGIKIETPGSAPASITVTKTRKVEVQKGIADKEEVKENLDVSLEIIDESSNSNSISHTPKVAKNRRRRKIEIDVKAEKINEEEESPKPMTREEWLKMRAEQKSMSVDERMRILFQQQNEQKGNVKKRKTPKKKQDQKKKVVTKLKKQPSASLTDQQGKKLICAKFKVTSPRKAALLKKTPKKKKSKDLNSIDTNKKLVVNTTVSITDEKKTVISESLPKLNESTPTVADTNKNESESNDLNRSDTVQEVANLLTNLPETILAKTNSFEQSTHSEVVNSNILLETPLKLDSMSPLPNTPRFAVPLVSIHQETPLTKLITTTTTAAVSILKVCDILTPSFPITPGFKETPLKSDASPEAASASGYSSRRTDYSSCSSYYKPDESEDINQNLDMIIKQSRGSERQSESDGGGIAMTSQEKILGSAKKVECPGALERVQSFKTEAKDIPMPHYTMMDEEGLLSESMLTTASDESSSSSFTCSTCSTDPSSDENTLALLNNSEILDDNRDSEWHCDDEIDVEKEVTSNNSLVDEKTGEVRFPLRNWITPKKVEPPKEEESRPIIEEPPKEEHQEKKKVFPDLEAIKQRTLKIIKSESAVNARKIQPKFKKSNAKAFKLPPEQPKVVALTRRDQILQQNNLTERPRPTPLKLISTIAHTSSSSRRKNATPRKTIIIDELPKAPSPLKKSRVKSKSQERKKVDNTTTATAAVAIVQKTPIKPERVSLENITDNAVCHDDHPSLNISTSFNDSSDEEENTVVVKAIEVKTVNEEGSNTFQRTLIAQGFDKKDAKDLQTQLVDKIENEHIEKISEQCEEVNKSKSESEHGSDEEDDDEEEDECEYVFSDVLEKNIFNFEESENFKIKKDAKKVAVTTCPASKLQIDGKVIKIDFSDHMEIFSMEPTTELKQKEESQQDKEKETTAKQESKILTKEIEIDKILTLIHGKH
ncbi:hypothetical protein PVAND_012714 [Polypedilum vanderplanki]|uniref:LisH domain-containing protein n=1 Tax=Polypedilum vanderplanki TaxID=319348 RepID=A0A9J6CMG5_POLVA|nr:hypothetical protein PVAND_012714 [Polypedilum vanderplanki]